jgi:DNA-binding HxlR family transcriptional regulator
LDGLLFHGILNAIMAGAPHTPPQLCHKFHRASELIGRRWTGAIIYLLLKERCRFATLRDAIPDITDRMLSDRLQELEEEGIVERTVFPETPVRVEYALTKKGRSLVAAFDAISQWADKWIELDAGPAAPARVSRARRARPRDAKPARGERRSSSTT